MTDCKIPIDTFVRETFDCTASVCAIFTGADIAFQNVHLHTRRDKSELYIMAGSTVLSVPLSSILGIEKLRFPDIHTIEYEISTKEGGTITVDAF